jgi:hypothetical protein
LGVQVDAVPEDAFGVDAAHKELEHKLEVAHTEEYIANNVQDSLCLICHISSKPDNKVDSKGKCVQSRS